MDTYTMSNDIKPYFRNDIARELQTIYLATINNGIEAARVIFLLCVSFGVPTSFMKPEHLQALQKDMKG